ncbi:MAG: GNAT family N-acetyltransferase [Gammaproteobacteria bacterium]|nr:GNAT family N-acetyltransferase [Gammaproteobacteria bacterium]
MTPEFTVREADWERDRRALRDVRTRVFVEEQDVPPDLEWDGLDAQCVHMLATAGGIPVGTGRLAPDGHIGRMAVVADWRGCGVGQALLEALMAAARERGHSHCRLNAQISAMGFYKRFGFEPHGVDFMEAGIVHRAMTHEFKR